MDKSAITLLELHQQVQQTLSKQFSDDIWVVGEISDLRSNKSGHCYLELIDKEESGERIRAKARANIWAYTWRMLKPYFETTTGKELCDGLKVLVSVSVEFHELYGYSLTIKDIDPTYTLGDLARKKLEIIKKLEEEGILLMNKELEFPLPAQKIAIISSASAAGYGDFIDQLEDNPYGYKFYTKLFEAYMQGENTEASITNALESIYQYEDFFDAVVIIRGGGSKSDLSDFDNYWIASNIAQFPLPVITGIGHDRDETITDMVAFKSLKTPTAVAEFLITALSELDYELDEIKDRFGEITKFVLSEHGQKLDKIAYNFIPFIKERLSATEHDLDLKRSETLYAAQSSLKQRNNEINIYHYKTESALRSNLVGKKSNLDSVIIKLKTVTEKTLNKHDHFLSNAMVTANYSDPDKILEKGFSISRVNGKIIKKISDANVNDELETIVKDGTLTSKITKK